MRPSSTFLAAGTPAMEPRTSTPRACSWLAVAFAAACLAAACSSTGGGNPAPVADTGEDAADALAGDTAVDGQAEAGSDTDDDAACDGLPANGCGGCDALPAEAGDACGCGRGTAVCDGADTVLCVDADGNELLRDGDGDGYGAGETAWGADCEASPAFSTRDHDCDDADPLVYPGTAAGACEGDALLVCGDEGELVPQACPEGSACLDGACVDRPCAPSFETVCRDGDVVACNATGTAFDQVVDCGDFGCVDGACDNNPWIVYVRVEPYEAGPELRGRLRLYAVRLDGSDHRVVDTGDAEAFAPALSPTGTHLAWTTADDTSVMLRVMDLRTGERWTTHTSGFIGGPTWSPDGTMVLGFGGEERTPFVQRAVPSPAGEAQYFAAELGGRLSSAFRYIWFDPHQDGCARVVRSVYVTGGVPPLRPMAVGIRIAGESIVEECGRLDDWTNADNIATFGHSRARRGATALVAFYADAESESSFAAIPVPLSGVTGAESPTRLPSAEMVPTADGARFVGIADRGDGQVDLVVIDADTGDVVRWLTDSPSLEMWPTISWAVDGGATPPGAPWIPGDAP